MQSQRQLSRTSHTVRSIFAVHGALDDASLPELRRRLGDFAHRTTGDVVIDCLDLVSIDDDGAAALLAFHHEMLGFGRRVTIKRVPTLCWPTFESGVLSSLSSEAPRRRA